MRRTGRVVVTDDDMVPRRLFGMSLPADDDRRRGVGMKAQMVCAEDDAL